MRHYYTTEGITYQTDWIIKHMQVDAMHHMQENNNYNLALGGVLRWRDISKLYRAWEAFLPSCSKTSLNLRRYTHRPFTGRLMDIAHRNGNSWLKPQAPIWLAGFQTIYVIQSAQVFNQSVSQSACWCGVIHYRLVFPKYHVNKLRLVGSYVSQTFSSCLSEWFFGWINSKVDQTLCWKSEVWLCKMRCRIINTMLI